jgi:hypothetical protein
MSTTSWQLLIDAIASEHDPIRKRNLEVVATHVVAEVAGDVDALLATMAPHPVYTIWGASSTPGPRGTEEVRAHYERLTASGKNRLEYDVMRVIAGDRVVVTEGRFRLAYPGTHVTQNVTEAGESVLPDHWYLVSYQCLVVWPINTDGLIEGEEIYAGEVPRAHRLLQDGEFPTLGPRDRRNGSVAWQDSVTDVAISPGAGPRRPLLYS